MGVFQLRGRRQAARVIVALTWISAGQGCIETQIVRGGGSNPLAKLVAGQILPLSLSSVSQNMYIGSSQEFTAAGGVPPYTFSLSAPVGTLSDTGLYTAPSATGQTQSVLVTARVTDSLGSQASVNIAVYRRPKVRFEKFSSNVTEFDSGTLQILVPVLLSESAPVATKVDWSLSNAYGHSLEGLTTSGTAIIPAEDAATGAGEIVISLTNNIAPGPDRLAVVNLTQRDLDSLRPDEGMTSHHVLIRDNDGGATNLATVSSGDGHTCAINAGVLKCWGRNTFGQLGNGTTTDSTTPVTVNGNYSAVAAGTHHTCAITSAGGLRCWGRDQYGQIGNGTTGGGSAIPVGIGLFLGSFSSITAGANHSCALSTGGTLYCWGSNGFGQVGNNSQQDQLTPVMITNLMFSAVSAGGNHTCAITTTERLKCWGRNSQGQLGYGNTTDLWQPVNNVETSYSYSAVSAGGNHTCALRANNILRCWGANGSGQLGTNGGGDSLSPAAVDNGTTYTAIRAGAEHTCGVVTGTSGQLKCWGRNTAGQLGDNTTTQRNTPTVVDVGTAYSAVASGGAHTCGVVTDGNLKCWGANDSGQLGINQMEQSYIPWDVEIGETFSQIASGNRHSCGTTATGHLKCWGQNSTGQLGDQTTTQRNTPVIIDPGTIYSSISAAGSHTCGVTTSGQLKCWGANANGQLGDGTLVQRNAPVVIDSGTTYTSVSVGENHSCGITTGRQLKCWGANANGQLGNNSTVNSSTPGGIDSTTLYSSVSLGHYHSCGITTAGQLKCWGSNSFYQLGDGTTDQRNAPVVIDSVTYASIFAGEFHSCGITSASGQLKCWGNSGDGQVGNGLLFSASTPQSIDSGTSYASASLGDFHTCGITTGGQAKCWGKNQYGELGDGTGILRQFPVEIDPYTDYASIAAGRGHTCGISTAGQLKCWGNNAEGQLGLFYRAVQNVPIPVPFR